MGPRMWLFTKNWEGFFYRAQVEHGGTVGKAEVLEGGIADFDALRNRTVENPLQKST